jgi:hypothetical protein
VPFLISLAGKVGDDLRGLADYVVLRHTGEWWSSPMPY